MKIFITGASGFLGTYLVQSLLEHGHTVHALVRNTTNLPTHDKLICFHGDLLLPDTIEKAIQGCEQVYHMAALAKVWTKDKQDYYKINVNGTINVMQAALKNGIKKMVFTSSGIVFGPSLLLPKNEKDPRIIGLKIDYERSKYMAEAACKDFIEKGLPIVIVNPTRIYGSENEYTNGVDFMIQQYLKGKWRMIPGDGNKKGNYAYIHDVVRGHILAMENGKPGEQYILGGDNLSFNELFQKIYDITGVHFKKFHIPLPLIYVFAYLQQIKYKITGKEPLITPEWVGRMKYHSIMSSQKAINEIGYTITPFTRGIVQCLNKEITAKAITSSHLSAFIPQKIQ